MLKYKFLSEGKIVLPGNTCFAFVRAQRRKSLKHPVNPRKPREKRKNLEVSTEGGKLPSILKAGWTFVLTDILSRLSRSPNEMRIEGGELLSGAALITISPIYPKIGSVKGKENHFLSP